MPGLTQKCPTQYASIAIAIIKHPPPLYGNYFQILFKHFDLKNQYMIKKIPVKTVQQRTPLWPGFHNALNKNFVIWVNCPSF